MHPPLGVCFHHYHVALERGGHLVPKLAQEKRKGAQRLLKLQDQQGGHALSQDHSHISG